MTAAQPRVLFVYFTVTQQTLKVVEAMTDTLRERGCEVRQARIEFTDPRYASRFSRFPFRHPWLLVAGMLSPQLRHVTGQIRVPDTVRGEDYRPRLHRVANVVVESLHADPFIHGVRPRRDGSRRKAVRSHRGLPPLLERQFGDREGAGNQERR
jgi:hypothetical protein